MRPMLQACLNGGRGRDAAPRVPITPEDLAADAVAVIAAGADELHVHPRDAAGRETLAPEDVAAALDAIRAAVPDIPVGIGTGAWIAPGGRKRHAHIQGWTVLPDFVSVNLCEPDAPDVMEMMYARGIEVEAGVWSLPDARRLTHEIPQSEVLRVLIEMQDWPGARARTEAALVIEHLKASGWRRPILLHGLDRSAWACLSEAAQRRLDTRIGFEDCLTLPDGRAAPDNASLVAAAASVIASGGGA